MLGYSDYNRDLRYARSLIILAITIAIGVYCVSFRLQAAAEGEEVACGHCFCDRALRARFKSYFVLGYSDNNRDLRYATMFVTDSVPSCSSLIGRFKLTVS